MSQKITGWLLFILLAVIWGSSFILMKIGLSNNLRPNDIAGIRMVASSIFLLPIAITSFKKIPTQKLPYAFLSGVLGSLLPAFLFCFAEEEVASSLAGVLNSLTPIFVIIIGALFFGRKTSTQKIIGIIIAFAGSILLILSKGAIKETKSIIYPLMIVVATIMYGINVNLVAKHLASFPSLQVASVALTLNAIPALLVLIFSGFFSLNFNDASIQKGIAASFVLGIGGTAIATILFYMLLKKMGAIFASMVTYGIPFVAVAWGIYFKEPFGWLQAICLLIILTGVFIVNRKKE